MEGKMNSCGTLTHDTQLYMLMLRSSASNPMSIDCPYKEHLTRLDWVWLPQTLMTTLSIEGQLHMSILIKHRSLLGPLFQPQQLG